MAGSISGIDWISRMPVSGVHTVTSAEAGADKVEINTGMSGAAGFIVQAVRSGAVVGAPKASLAAGVLKIEDNSTNYDVTAGDVISWIVF